MTLAYFGPPLNPAMSFTSGLSPEDLRSHKIVRAVSYLLRSLDQALTVNAVKEYLAVAGVRMRAARLCALIRLEKFEQARKDHQGVEVAKTPADFLALLRAFDATNTKYEGNAGKCEIDDFEHEMGAPGKRSRARYHTKTNKDVTPAPREAQEVSPPEVGENVAEQAVEVTAEALALPLLIPAEAPVQASPTIPEAPSAPDIENNSRSNAQNGASKPRGARKEPDPVSVAGWGITQALAPLVAPLLTGITASAWRTQNNRDARDMAEAGTTPEQAVAAWHYFAQKGKRHTRVRWLAEAMTTARASRSAVAEGAPIVATMASKVAEAAATRCAQGFVVSADPEIRAAQQAALLARDPKKVYPGDRGFSEGKPRLYAPGMSGRGWHSCAPAGARPEAVKAWLDRGEDLGGWDDPLPPVPMGPPPGWREKMAGITARLEASRLASEQAARERIGRWSR